MWMNGRPESRVVKYEDTKICKTRKMNHTKERGNFKNRRTKLKRTEKFWIKDREDETLKRTGEL